jgi:hypothetical protein
MYDLYLYKIFTDLQIGRYDAAPADLLTAAAAAAAGAAIVLDL